MIDNNFYRAFEDKYRGDRELIKSRLEVYVPFVDNLKIIEAIPKAIDLGCGRGEWLELLGENGFEAYGVDLNEGMLEACKEKGFKVECKNAIDMIKELENESLLVVSSFHLIEHISFEDLQVVVQEALRVLKPGGLLILETPNPENIKIATSNFYLDPTHTKPIPSELLSFLTEYYGYSRTKVVRLQESKDLINQTSINLLQVIDGVSPDYAVIAQKEASVDILDAFDEAFEKNYGLSLENLISRFENRFNNVETRATEALSMYNNLINSRSWKLTKSLRWFEGLFKK